MINLKCLRCDAKSLLEITIQSEHSILPRLYCIKCKTFHEPKYTGSNNRDLNIRFSRRLYGYDYSTTGKYWIAAYDHLLYPGNIWP